MAFPEDYIAPGEFAFCGRCGEVCREGEKDFWCNGCLDSFSGKPCDENLDVVKWLSIRESAMRANQERIERRRLIAQGRKNIGVKPLFWMKGKRCCTPGF